MNQANADLLSQRSRNVRQRRQYFVDRDVQGAFLKHGIFYWFYASLVFGAIVFIYRVFPALISGQPGEVWYHLAPFFLASAVLFPVIIWNAIRFSHRFAGPMVRVRRALRALAEGDTPAPITFREDDFWPEVADCINQIGRRIETKSTSKRDADFRLTTGNSGSATSVLPDRQPAAADADEAEYAELSSR